MNTFKSITNRSGTILDGFTAKYRENAKVTILVQETSSIKAFQTAVGDFLIVF
jgi:hypothetical protein